MKKEILNQFKNWASGNPLIRAALLNSSRANPHAEIDFLSDYDILLYVSDISHFRHNDNWLEPLGRVMVRWPLYPRSTFDPVWLTRLILFKDGTRIDFQITDTKEVNPAFSDYGYRILLDKDKILKHIPDPTYTRYNITKPTETEYEEIVKEFWWDATYVPKYLYRDQLPFAKSMMAQAIHKQFLYQVIEWYIGLKNNWSVNTGVCGCFFKKYLDLQTWKEFESTFADADIENNWKAFFNAVSLFGKLAGIIGAELDYEYPASIEKEMTEYYHMIYNKRR